MTYTIGIAAVVAIAILYYFVGRKAGREECSKALSGPNIFEDDWAENKYDAWKETHR